MSEDTQWHCGCRDKYEHGTPRGKSPAASILEKLDYRTVVTNEIIRFLYAQHDRHSDGGCKRSCAEIEVGYRVNRYGEAEYFCNFGGYCLGDLNRHESVSALTLAGLQAAVVAKVEAGVLMPPPRAEEKG